MPFSTYDNGGDLVETAFLAQGLVCVAEYFKKSSDATEVALAIQIRDLLYGIEWNWHRQAGTNVLTWHWSPNYNFIMNASLYGYMEGMVTYVLAASSPTYGIPAEVCRNGN